MPDADGWITVVGTGDAEDDDFRPIAHRHMRGACFAAPKAEQGQVAGDQPVHRKPPHCLRHLHPRPELVNGDAFTCRDKVRQNTYPNNAATCWNHTSNGGGNQIPASNTARQRTAVGLANCSRCLGLGRNPC